MVAAVAHLAHHQKNLAPSGKVFINTMTIDYKKADILAIEQLHQEQGNEDRDLLLFVGHAHSGHSIIGSILDCHQHVVLANEVNIVKTISEHRLTARQIEAVLLHEARTSSDNKWLNSEYQYDIDRSLQGDAMKEPRVVGDKKAGGTTRILRRDPWLLDYLLSIYGKRLKFIFVQRNPLDVVAAYSYYMKQPICQFHVDRYVENYQTAEHIKNAVDAEQFIQISQEAFIQAPVEQVTALFTFLNLAENLSPADLTRWCGIVRKDIQGKSQQIKVPEQLAAQVKGYA